MLVFPCYVHSSSLLARLCECCLVSPCLLTDCHPDQSCVVLLAQAILYCAGIEIYRISKRMHCNTILQFHLIHITRRSCAYQQLRVHFLQCAIRSLLRISLQLLLDTQGLLLGSLVLRFVLHLRSITFLKRVGLPNS